MSDRWDKQWGVYEGDCLDVLAEMPDGLADHIITDPPYSEHVHSKSMRAVNRSGQISESRDLGFASLTDRLREGVSDQIARLTQRWAIVFCNVEGVSAWEADLTCEPEPDEPQHRLEYIRTMVWVKPGAAPQFTGDRPGMGFECMVVAHPKGRKRWNGGGKLGVYSHTIEIGRNGAGSPRLHTTQKPLPLMIDLVRDFTDPGNLIVDPFCGSGTTGVAALQLGRRFIGIEKDPKYAEIARERLEKVEEDPIFFGARKKKQDKLLTTTACPKPVYSERFGESD